MQEAVFRLLDRLPELVDKLPPPAVKFLTEQAKLPFLVNRSLRSAEVVAQPVAEDVQPVLAVPVSPVYIKGSRGLTVGQALGTQQFWLLWSMIITCATAGLNTAAVYKQFAATSAALTGDEFQALVGGIGALFNGIGRVFWGTVSDKIGFKASFTILSILQAGSMLTYTMAAQSKVSCTYYSNFQQLHVVCTCKFLEHYLIFYLVTLPNLYLMFVSLFLLCVYRVSSP